MRQRLTAGSLALVVALGAAGCTASQGILPGVRPSDADSGPAYFTQATDQGTRYAHNWVNRPCFTIDLPGHDWVLQSATPDFVLWRNGDHVLKVYLTDNRTEGFAVSGMNAEGALRAFIGYELDFIKPKFDSQYSPAPALRTNDNGTWALWSWEGRGGRRAGVGKAQPADQRHTLASLWLDPWVLTFDWATAKIDMPETDSPELRGALDSLTFHPECFQAMRTGETWSNVSVGAKEAGAVRGSEPPPPRADPAGGWDQ